LLQCLCLLVRCGAATVPWTATSACSTGSRQVEWRLTPVTASGGAPVRQQWHGMSLLVVISTAAPWSTWPGAAGSAGAHSHSCQISHVCRGGLQMGAGAWFHPVWHQCSRRCTVQASCHTRQSACTSAIARLHESANVWPWVLSTHAGTAAGCRVVWCGAFRHQEGVHEAACHSTMQLGVVVATAAADSCVVAG
jgi:hypothetical protein